MAMAWFPLKAFQEQPQSENKKLLLTHSVAFIHVI